MDPVTVAAWGFSAGADVAENARAIALGLEEAAAAQARILLTPECALTGYPGAARDGLLGLDWEAVASEERRLAALARERGILLVLGSVERDAGAAYNVALACGALPGTRYRKRCLIPQERAVFAPGQAPALIDHRGWRWGLGICFDLRFPDPWLELAAAGADAFLVIAHMAGADPDPGTKATLIPQLCAVRAAETATPLVLCNTSAPDRHCPSLSCDARGIRAASRPQGLLVAQVTHRRGLDPWYQGLHDAAVARWRRAPRA